MVQEIHNINVHVCCRHVYTKIMPINSTIVYCVNIIMAIDLTNYTASELSYSHVVIRYKQE